MTDRVARQKKLKELIVYVGGAPYPAVNRRWRASVQVQLGRRRNARKSHEL